MSNKFPAIREHDYRHGAKTSGAVGLSDVFHPVQQFDQIRRVRRIFSRVSSAPHSRQTR
ncbi:uncharacterized protein METZ01_LOCUS13885 [marine metagenome]|uniref:Uncharacterized protein n=1 Tax=marine metagenome TaxID=408172 RepID=A0A381P293_9ZZZZ